MNAPRRLRAWIAGVALVLPCAAVLCVPTFNAIEPRLFGLPFFYAYQLLWVPLSAACIGVAYRAYEG